MTDQALVKKEKKPLTALEKQQNTRRKEVEILWVEKGMSVNQIANKMNVSLHVIWNDIRYLSNMDWKTKGQKSSKVHKYLVGRQLELVFERAMQAYEASKDGGLVEITTKEVVECPVCKGLAADDDDDFCRKCKGKGEITQTKITYERKILPGDTAHLNTALKALESIRKLYGMDSPIRRHLRAHVKGEFLSAHINANNPLADAPAEMIHDIMAEIYDRKDNRTISLPPAKPPE